MISNVNNICVSENTPVLLEYRFVYNNQIWPCVFRITSFLSARVFPHVYAFWVWLVIHFLYRDVWKMYLDKGQFDLAKDFCKVQWVLMCVTLTQMIIHSYPSDMDGDRGKWTEWKKETDFRHPTLYLSLFICRILTYLFQRLYDKIPLSGGQPCKSEGALRAPLSVFCLYNQNLKSDCHQIFWIWSIFHTSAESFRGRSNESKFMTTFLRGVQQKLILYKAQETKFPKFQCVVAT